MGRPQAVIFEQLPPKGWHIFVGILWRRFGHPPGARDPETDQEFGSGTEEEFRAAYRLWSAHPEHGPHILFYVCDRKPKPGSDDTKQHQRVQDFICEFSANGSFPGLYRTFRWRTDFERDLRNDLRRVIYRRFAVAQPPENQARLQASPVTLRQVQTPATASPIQSPIKEKNADLVIETVLIAEGEFWMGSSVDDPLASRNEKPQHSVDLPSYSIGKYPVTNAQYYAFVASSPEHDPPVHWADGKPPAGKETHPVVNVSHAEAQAFCQWLSVQTGQIYRLPTEKEWEKAARGPTPRKVAYPWGDEWHAMHCNCQEEGLGSTTPIDAFDHVNCSTFGAMDMVGNVCEWTDSYYWPYPNSTYRMRSRGPEFRVVRGGSWRHSSTESRVSSRGRQPRSTARPYIGFRIVLEKD
jgi:formylglycine-generating enzyme required for sulfatase activity